METLQIKKENVMQAYKEANGELKKALATAFGLTWQSPTEAFKSYEDVCASVGIDPVASLPFPKPFSKKEVSLNGCFKLETIFDEFNRDANGVIWEPDYTKKAQAKWYPYHEWSPSLGVFVFTNTCYTLTNTYLGARLCTDTDAKATYIAKTFNKEWNEFLNPQI